MGSIAGLDFFDDPGALTTLLEALLETTQSPLIIWDLDGRPILYNRAAYAALGYSREEFRHIRRTDLIHADDQRAVATMVASRRGGDASTRTYERRVVTKTGEAINTRCHSVPLLVAGTVRGNLVEYQDITSQRRAEHSEKSRAILYRELFERSPQAVFITDATGQITDVNAAAGRLTGRDREALLLLRMGDILASSEWEVDDEAARQMLEHRYLEHEIVHADGDTVWAGLHVRRMTDENGRLTGHHVIANDISGTKARESQLTADARQDPLTGLGNRRAFDLALETLRNSGRTSGVTILVADVDGLKGVNDHLGHIAGDRVTREVAATLRARTRADDQIFRVGGDEFVILSLTDRVEELAARLSAPISADGEMPVVLMSVGHASLGVDTTDPEVAFRLADERMLARKSRRPRGVSAA
ncbi:MAG: PAS domain S-box protein [Dehalococcoidia bacterium]|nr:PAS domain S-box protein [Dehalococcoidia bacterium]